jgi:hypothetical protein
MKGTLQHLAVGVVFLSSFAIASVAVARGGGSHMEVGRGVGRGQELGEPICA